MKKLFAIAAVSVMLSTTGAFAACPCKVQPNYKPVERITYAQQVVPAKIDPCCNPCCDPCAKNVKKTGFFGNIMNGTRTVYDATLGNFFNMFTY